MANLTTQQFITDEPLADYHPQSWLTVLDNESTTMLSFRNTEHFKNTVSAITQLDDIKCDISYADALQELRAGVSTISDNNYQTIKYKVKESLLKRKLISDTIYSGFEYSVSGELIDIARYLAGNPECAIVPKSAGKNYFYELYINSSIPWTVDDEDVQNKLAKILATVELLESKRIYIKINAVFTARNVNRGDGKPNLLITIPVHSYQDIKSISTLSSFINVRLLRKFGFAIFEDLYGDDIADGYGTPVQLPNCINLQDDFDAVSTVESILDELVVPCKPRKA